MKKTFISFITFFLIITSVNAQHFNVEKTSFVYKVIDGQNLEMVMYKPQIANRLELPALVFFFGGGWVNGEPYQFELQAEYFASRGMVVFCPDYRTKSKHGTSPFESVKDAKSAIRFLKINAANFSIDSAKIVVSGGSAGGHLAASTAILKNFNEETDDLKISTKPVAMVLFNPVVDTGKKGYGQEKLEGREFEISPVHNITSGVPPTLIMHGKNDKTVPYENVVRFKQAMKQEGNKCILKGYKKQIHGFFNHSNNSKYFKKTLAKTETFLENYNFLLGESWVKEYCKELN